MVGKFNQELLLRIRNLHEEVDLLRDIETSVKKDREDLEDEYSSRRKKSKTWDWKGKTWKRVCRISK